MSRSCGEDPLIKTLDGRPVEWDVGSGSFFRADIYSQNEVENIADRAISQLTLIDNFEPRNIALVESRLQEAVLALTANEGRIVPLKDQISELSEDLATLPCVQEKIDGLLETQSDDADAINQAHAHKSLRDREARLLTSVSTMLSQVQRSAHDLKGRVARDWSRLADPDVTNGPNRLLIEDAAVEVRRCGDVVDELSGRINEAVEEAIQQLTAVFDRLKEVHFQQESDFRGLMAKHEQAQGQAAERARWERRGNELLQKERERQQLTTELEAFQCDRQELLRQLSELRDERFSIRQSVAEKINADLSPTIRVSIVQFGDTDEYERLLESNLPLAKIKHHVVAKKVVKNICPTDLVDILARHDKGALVERADLNVDQAEKVVAALNQDRILCALETVELNDRPKIELCDGGVYKESCSLSTGQKCTVILPILLLDSDNPLLIDQPEDNLDNRFIYETVVQNICKNKNRRQMIFITHNPNIPVLGDAERVFVLESDGARARKSHDGTVDECRDQIVTLLEGGEEAFEARKTRYACQ